MSGYERRWSSVCRDGRAPARPERHAHVLEESQMFPKAPAAVLKIVAGKRDAAPELTTQPIGLPAETASRAAQLWEHHGVGVARCFSGLSMALVQVGRDGALDPEPAALPDRVACLRALSPLLRQALQLPENAALVLHYVDPSKPPEHPVAGFLSGEQISSVISAQQARFASCYQDARAVWPALEGRVTMRFIVAADGTVDTAEVLDSSVGHAAFDCCIASVTAGLVFDRPRGGIVVATYPFTFRRPASAPQ